jgi:hypothetical protein
MSDETRCVFVANGEILAQETCAFLRAAGIDAIVRGETLIKTHGLTLGALGAVEVCVSPADESRARELLKSAEAGEFQLDEGSDE